jgi:putative transposase
MTARNVARAVTLQPPQRGQLENLAASRSLPHALVCRARVVLMAAKGMPNVAIAQHVGMTRETVGKWRKRFVERGIAGLHDELRPGRPRTVSDEKVAALIKKTLETTPSDGTHWSCRRMAKETGLSKATVQRIWNAFMVQPHRHKHFKLSNDPFFVEKVRDIVGLYLNPPDNAMVLCVDEKSQIQALERTQPLLPMGMGYVEGVTHDYLRHGTTTLFAALDIANGQVIAQCKKRHRHQEFLGFLRRIEASVPKDLDVHLVIDNYATHKHAKVRNWLATRPRYTVHYTPTYSSWLNQVEIWFNIITQRAIRRGTFRSVRQLIEKIDLFVGNYNQHSTPFAWTATADSIFEKLSRLCECISETQH